ncbi:MAG: phosphotransferase [Ardenticatenaceae bacterium]
MINDKPRVLVVENDNRWRLVHEKNLTRWGWLPFIAQGEGQSLLKDAIDKVLIYRCHAALVDLRLVDHDSRSDNSGLNLIPKLQPTPSIIVSGYADFFVARTALMEKGARHFIGKEEGPELLKQVIEEVLQTMCAATKEIEIEWPPGLSAQAIVSRLLPDARDSVPIDQVNDVLGLLFPDAKRLRLETLDGLNELSQSGPRLHSVVLKVYIDDFLQPEFLKIASPEDIQTQGERYRSYVEGRLFGTFHSLLKKEVYLWDIGAATYDFLSAPNQKMKTWAQLYQSTESIDELVKPLQFFFDELWSHHYHLENQKSGPHLLKAYCNVWGKNWCNRLQDAYQGKYLKIYALKPDLLNPVRWLLDRQSNGTIPPTRLAITHGDLHGGNLFVYDGHAWVIDFERTGPGPIYQDFVELETDLLVQLTHFEDLQTFHNLVSTLLSATTADQIKLGSPTHKKTDANKALAVIKALRQLAEKTIPKFNMKQYLWGLLFDSLFLISLPALKHPQNKAQHDRALLLGGLICERLENATPFSPARKS